MIELILLQQEPTFWQKASWVASSFGFLGVLVAALALIGSWRANKANAKAERARFWLELRRMFASHDNVHKKLRPGGEWAKPGKEDEPRRGSDDEADLIAYMGLFEHCEFMLQQKLIDEGTFKRIYAYRLNALLRNNSVKRKLAMHDSQGRFVRLREPRDEEGSWDALQKLLIRCNKLELLKRGRLRHAKQTSEPPPLTAEQRQRVTNFAKKLKD